ncbi:hypothetical protein ElyMa_000177800 [Elysia marginata]|uniref:Uncharacterized protein n=1 Tax=Elysia marginata TaxID=1093978 RepID=A0AAV4EU83_9GAST|nr:hypothetical protein ElyMa_000177800 [Elysia marginata]
MSAARVPVSGNSPHPLVTSLAPNESALRLVSNISEGHQLFNFTRPAAPVPVIMPQIPVSSTVNRTNSSYIVFPEALDKHHAADFPDYKYRPKKKATKEANKKLETCTKTNSNMRRKSQSTTNQPQQQQQNHQVLTPPVEGITVSGPPANLDRAQLQRKLQPKQNMRKDPGMRRDVSLSQGVCFTAVSISRTGGQAVLSATH